MIVQRQRCYTGLVKKVSAKTQRSILNKAEQFFKSKPGQTYLKHQLKARESALGKELLKRSGNVESGMATLSGIVKGAPYNPGKTTKELIGYGIKHPEVAFGEAADKALGVIVPAYNASPVPVGKAIAFAYPTKNRYFRLAGQRWNTGGAGRVVEQGINSAALSAGRLGNSIPML